MPSTNRIYGGEKIFLTPDERAQMLRGASDQFATDITYLPRYLQEYLAPPTPLTPGEMRNPQLGTLESLRADNRQWDEFQQYQPEMYQQGRSLGTAGAIVADPLNYMAEAVPLVRGAGRLASMVAREAATPQGLRTMTNALTNQRGMVSIPKKTNVMADGLNYLKDEIGNDLTLYHGTPRGGFGQFKENTSADIDGFYFAKNPEYTENYSLGGFKDDASKATGQNVDSATGTGGPATYPVNLVAKKILSFTEGINKNDDFVSKVAGLDDFSNKLVSEAINEGGNNERVYDIAFEFYKDDIARNINQTVDLDEIAKGKSSNDMIEYLANKKGITQKEYAQKELKGEIVSTEKDIEDYYRNFERNIDKNAHKKATDLMRESGYDTVYRPDSFKMEDGNKAFNPFSKKRDEDTNPTYISLYPENIISKFKKQKAE